MFLLFSVRAANFVSDETIQDDLGVFKKKYEVCHKSASFWPGTCYSLSFAGSLYFLPQTSKDETVAVNVRRGGFGSG